ncbi:MAG: M23 family metallopeptidase [Leptospiraceae bacterium]|nr:M23 family metallopeptidase [Leptospiraceae bacterium]MDW7975364.1 M23 family metallopeptidase [Leptospiraceae bacterium]
MEFSNINYVKYRYLIRKLQKFINWGWGGVTIMIYTDIRNDPKKLRLNLFSILFFIVLLYIMIFLVFTFWIDKYQDEVFTEKLKTKQYLIINLYYSLQIKNHYFHKIEKNLKKLYEYSKWDEFLDQYLKKQKNHQIQQRTTKIEEEIDLANKLKEQINHEFFTKTKFLLEQLWHKTHIYAVIPKGTPMFLGTFYITSGFGVREDPFNDVIGNFHTGVDFASAENTPIIAVNDGKVVKVSFLPNNSGYGNYVIIHHGLGFQTLYAHCSRITVQEQSWVSADQIIAYVGRTGRATGNHLHYEVRVGFENPIDPDLFLKLK